MKLKNIFLVPLMLFPTFSLFAEMPANTTPLEIIKLIEGNRKLVNEGKFVEAKKGYEQLLKHPALKKNDRRLVRKDYEKLNIKMILSPKQTPDSFMHTVVQGDSLYLLAKKYNTPVSLIKKSNKLKSDTIILGKKLKIQKGIFSVTVDKSENRLSLYLNDHLIKTYRVATGENNSTPIGKFKIVTKVEKPIWYHKGKAVPAGDPENIIGTRWMGFDLKSYGIHGTTKPESIGQQVSSGCVRMLNHEVEELYDLLPLKTEVIVKD